MVEQPRTSNNIHQLVCLFSKSVPIVLGVIFLVSGVQKIRDPIPLYYTFYHIGFGMDSGLIMAKLIAIVEVLLGVSLFFRPVPQFSLMFSIGLLVSYTLFLFYLLSLDKPVGCGCGGLLEWFQNSKANAVLGICRNLILAASLMFSARTLRSSLQNVSGGDPVDKEIVSIGEGR